MAGQPTKYNEDMQFKADAYVESFKNNGREWVPTNGELALELDVHVTTLDNWKETQPAFFRTLGTLKNLQHALLVRHGLTNTFCPTIAKLMLFNHGYSEKSETKVDATVKEQSEEEIQDELEAVRDEIQSL